MKIEDLKFTNSDQFLKGCLFDSFNKELKAITEDILKKASSTNEFIDIFLASEKPLVINSQAYAEVSKRLRPDGHWKRIRRMIGDRQFKTYADKGGVKVGVPNFSIIMPSGGGDGTVRVAIVSHRELNMNMFEFFTSIEGDINIYSYDCGDDVYYTISGRYGVYYCEGFVIFEKWE